MDEDLLEMITGMKPYGRVNTDSYIKTQKHFQITYWRRKKDMKESL